MMVYANHPTTGKVIGLIYGESGYYSITTDCSATLLNSLNSGASEEVAESYLAGSLFGWNCPRSKLAREFSQSKCQHPEDRRVTSDLGEYCGDCDKVLSVS